VIIVKQNRISAPLLYPHTMQEKMNQIQENGLW